MIHQNSDCLIGLAASLLKRNHLERPTGQPLYQYQLTEGEYVQLKAALQQQALVSTRAAFDPPFCAAFCLFCAEWFRREYTGGWSWHPIWESYDDFWCMT